MEWKQVADLLVEDKGGAAVLARILTLPLWENDRGEADLRSDMPHRGLRWVAENSGVSNMAMALPTLLPGHERHQAS